MATTLIQAEVVQVKSRRIDLAIWNPFLSAIHVQPLRIERPLRTREEEPN